MKKQKKSTAEKVLRVEEDSTEQLQDANRAVKLAAVNAGLCKLIGVVDGSLAGRIVSQMQAMQVWGRDSEALETFTSAMAMMSELKPSNATEALLAVQMFGVHEAALLFLQRATAAGQTFEDSDANVHRAVRLMRLFLEQLEAMAKLKGKTGQQKVVVEHVQVNAGGQAIVGSVTTAPRGRGGKNDS